MDHSHSFHSSHPSHPSGQLQLLIAEHIALAGVVLDGRDEENEESGEYKREIAEEEAREVPGNRRKSEHLKRLECFQPPPT